MLLSNTYDFVALPESVDDDCASDAYQSDVTTPPGASSSSRYVVFKEFTSSVGDDDYAGKGVGYVSLHSATRPVSDIKVFFTRTNASSSNVTAAGTWFNWQTIRQAQMREVRDFYRCIKSHGQITDLDNIVLLGDLNINGDLSNPAPASWYDSLWDGPPAIDRKNSRLEWDTLFNPANPAATSDFMDFSFFSKELKDQWFTAMTPWIMPVDGADCHPGSLADPAVGCAVPGSAFPTPYTGSALGTPFVPKEPGDSKWDRGMTMLDVYDDQRIDYVFLKAPLQVNTGKTLTSMHLTESANVYANGLFPLTGCLPGGPGCGTDPTSDHRGTSSLLALLGAPTNPKSDGYYNPSTAKLNPSTGDTFRMQSSEVQWFRFDAPGTYTFKVDGWTSVSLPPVYEVYRGADLTHALVPYRGQELRSPAKPPLCVNTDMVCNPADPHSCDTSPWNNDRRCLPAVPEFIERKFKVDRAPLYVKVAQPAGIPGSYRLFSHRSLCRNLDEACEILPFEQRDVGDTTDQQVFGAGVSDLFYSFSVDQADSNQPQQMSVTVREPGSTSHISFVQIVDRDTGAVRATITTPSTSAPGRLDWTFQFPTPLASLENKERWAVHIAKNAGVSSDFPFWVYWQTNLTYVYGASMLGREATMSLTDDDAEDDYGHDEMYANFVIDNNFWDLFNGGSRGSSYIPKTDASGMFHISDDFHEEAKTQSFEQQVLMSFRSASPRPVRKGAIRFVERMKIEVCEDDDSDDECGMVEIPPLGPRVQPEEAYLTPIIPLAEIGSDPDGHYQLQFNRSHFITAQACRFDADCPSPTGLIKCSLFAGATLGVCK